MQILRDKGSIGYIVDLLSNITMKNEHLALKKMNNLLKQTKRKEEKVIGKYTANEEKYKVVNEDETVPEIPDNEGTKAESRNVNRINVQSDDVFMKNGL